MISFLNQFQETVVFGVEVICRGQPSKSRLMASFQDATIHKTTNNRLSIESKAVCNGQLTLSYKYFGKGLGRMATGAWMTLCFEDSSPVRTTYGNDKQRSSSCKDNTKEVPTSRQPVF